MIKSFLAVAANRVIIDAISNHVSIIDVLEAIKSQAFPVVIPNITFLFYLNRDKGDASKQSFFLKCTIDETEILKLPVNTDFNEGLTSRAIISFDGFVIPKPGTLKVALMDKEVELDGLELTVQQLEVAAPHVKQPNAPQAGT